jgi:hypothetical protein
MNSKAKLYSLLDDFIHNRMPIELFCRLFSATYHFDIDEDCLTNEEQESFSVLADMAYGYTDSEEERLICTQYYFSDIQIVAKVDEICAKLDIASTD